MTVGGREWKPSDGYDWNGEWGWQTAFTEDDYADGISLEDYEDIHILGGDVPQYFVFIQEQQDGTYQTSISATNGPRLPRSGMASPIGGDDYRETTSLADAVAAARDLMKRIA
jgi:hypothetical protein